MIQELKKYQVNIFGESYTIVTDESQKEIDDTASYVDSLMKEVSGKSNTDPKKVAVFVALKIARKMFELEVQKNKLLEAQTALVKMIDEQVK